MPSIVCCADEPAPTANQLEFFEKKVRPLLVEHCYSCHSTKADKVQASLLLDSRASLLKGGDTGEAIVPGDVDASLLIEAVRYDSYEMPPEKKLPQNAIETLERWVEMGAPWPHEDPPSSAASLPEFNLLQRKSEHWVWQPINTPKVPDVTNQSWPRNDVDHFILHRLENARLRPTRGAERTALVRRLYFDLIGLPPTIEQTAKFIQDDTPQATERLVDELLDSPHFGERWGRHWLDLMRYAESRGHEFDNDSPNAFQYRDYVIRALNEDVPYDQLVREHIAGDLLESPRLHPKEGYNESVLGTGFWFLGEWMHSPVDIRKDETDRFDNMIDVMSKAFLGVTVSCARCHDHKFDAISTADYYSLTGFLQSSDYHQVRFESLESNRRIAHQLSDLDARFGQAIHEELAAIGLTMPTEQPIDEALSRHIEVNYESLPTDQYLQDGFIFGAVPCRSGSVYLVKMGEDWTIRLATRSTAVSDPFWNEMKTITEKGVHNRSEVAPLPRSGRTLRTPSFLLTTGTIACRVHGKGHVVACVDSHRMITGPLHGETIEPISPGQDWVELKLDRYIGHRLHLEFTPAKGAQLEVAFVTQETTGEIRQQLERHEATVAENVGRLNQSVVKLLSGDTLVSQRLKELVDAWADERSKLQKQIVLRSKVAMAMMDGNGEEDHILIRGNSSKPGDMEPRHFLTAITGDQPMDIPVGSGRLELARQINDPKNPLTSRVIVNRIWHHLMGRGIVPTTDDFGVLGQRPTHPELLDHLSVRFNNDGHSIKRMIRYIILSRTYAMSSYAEPSAVESDPKNQLWHHRPLRRLESEIIRDALLAVSGQLDKTQFGEPVPIHLTSFMEGRGRPKKSGPLDGDRRRSIYIAIRRNFLAPFMLTFDTPVPFSTMGRRNVSNVPAQSLILMNDPFVAQQARAWAELVLEKNSADESRIRWMYERAFARQPTDGELATATQYVTDQAVERSATNDDIDLWSDFAHALINTKEFIFIR